MKKIIATLLILSSNLTFSQDYFEGKRLYCKSENPEAMKLFNLGIETLYLNKSLDQKYLKITSNIFFKAYKADTTFCDAIFFTGYTLRLLNDEKAIACYIMADSLSKKTLEFKINLASEGLRVGNEKSLEIARKKYNELITLFPENPEGYYGFALTSPIFGDTDKGLENINIAIEKYKLLNPKLNDEVIFLKGILLSQNKKYDESLEYLEKCYSTYKKDENFKIHYSLCLLKVSEIKNDEKMKQKAFKFYGQIENKEQIPEDIKVLLKF
jgi:tetratricopeptide (TPR) repeat protein